jgi:hypothetical protein
MSNTKVWDRQASSYSCQRPTVGAVLKLLIQLKDYYAEYISYYTSYFQNTNGVSGENSLRKSTSMISRRGAEAAKHHSAGAAAANHPLSTTIFLSN